MSALSSKTAHRQPYREAHETLGAIAAIRNSKPTYWPDNCPDCKAPMEFAFSPSVHRRCTACARTVTEADVASISPVSGLRSPVSR